MTKKISTSNRQQIILASGSPRRKQLLEQIGLKFKVAKSDYEENMKQKIKPEKMVQIFSLGKARDVARKYKNAIIIGSDTVVTHKNKILGKPKNPTEAKKMLKMLSGKKHIVMTGITVIDTKTGKTITDHESSEVFFRKLNEEEINNYVKSGEPLDKAGAYGIQKLGATIVQKINGDYFTVVGLPLVKLAIILKKFGIRIL